MLTRKCIRKWKWSAYKNDTQRTRELEEHSAFAIAIRQLA